MNTQSKVELRNRDYRNRSICDFTYLDLNSQTWNTTLKNLIIFQKISNELFDWQKFCLQATRLKNS